MKEHNENLDASTSNRDNNQFTEAVGPASGTKKIIHVRQQTPQEAENIARKNKTTQSLKNRGGRYGLDFLL